MARKSDYKKAAAQAISADHSNTSPLALLAMIIRLSEQVGALEAGEVAPPVEADPAPAPAAAVPAPKPPVVVSVVPPPPAAPAPAPAAPAATSAPAPAPVTGLSTPL